MHADIDGALDPCSYYLQVDRVIVSVTTYLYAKPGRLASFYNILYLMNYFSFCEKSLT